MTRTIVKKAARFTTPISAPRHLQLPVDPSRIPSALIIDRRVFESLVVGLIRYNLSPRQVLSVRVSTMIETLRTIDFGQRGVYCSARRLR